MKKIRVFLTAAMLMVGFVSHAQTTIRGLLVDSVTHEGEPYATVRVYKGAIKGTAEAMSVTDADGKIEQKIDGRGTYHVVVSSVGRKTIRRDVHLSGQSAIDLGTLYATDDAMQLSGVEVVAQKPIVKMTTDKMTYDVQSDVDSKSQTVLDMLRKVPMVTVDGQDNISVNGQSSFKVYVDGKPSIMFSSNPSQIFKSMPASAVKSIEVITNPGAKYDAEGAGGILDIIMNHAEGEKAATNAYNGTLRTTLTNLNWGGSAFVSGQQGKFTYSVNAFAVKVFPNKTEVNLDRTQNTALGTTAMHYFQAGKSRQPFAMGSLSLGYEIDSMSQVNATMNIHKFKLTTEGHPITSFSGGVYGTGFSYGNQMRMEQGNTSFDASLDYQRFLNAARTSNITFTYLFTTAPTKNTNENIYDSFDYESLQNAGIAAPTLVNLFSDNRTHAREHIFQADYVTPLAENHTFSAGTKYTGRFSHSDAKYYNIVDGERLFNELNSSNYKNNQSILAGYAEYNGSFGKISTRLGARYEHTWENVKYVLGAGENFHRNYGNFVPSGSVTYGFTATTNLGLSYSLRIIRPGISYLNPYIDRSNPTSLTYGNPDLDVEKSHNVNLVFNYFSPKFMTNITFGQSFCNNQIYQYSFMDGTILNQTYGNIVKNRWTNLNAFFNYSPSAKTRFMTNLHVGYGDMRSTQLAFRNSGWEFNGFFNIQQTLPWDIKWSLGAFAKTRDVSLQGRNGAMGVMFTTLTKDLIKDKLNLSLMYSVPFRGKMHIKNESFGTDFYQKNDITIHMQAVGFTLTWTFGNTKKAFQSHQSKASSDFDERKSTGEQMGGMGSGSGIGM